MSTLTLTPALREYLKKRGATYVAIDIIDCVTWGSHTSEVFAFAPGGKPNKLALERASHRFDLDGIIVLVTSPALIMEDEVLLDYCPGKVMGGIAVTGMSTPVRPGVYQWRG